MEIVQKVVDWTWEIFGSFGAFGLFALAFIEASFFPVPIEALLIPLTLMDPGNFLLYSFVSVVGSVLGAIFGYYIGVVGKKIVLERMFSQKKIEKVHEMFDRHGALAIFIGGFTPLPFKVFTVSGGAFYINFRKFVLMSILSRGLRFFTIGFLIYLYGEQIMGFMNQYFDVATLVIVFIILIVYLIYRRIKLDGKKGIFI